TKASAVKTMVLMVASRPGTVDYCGSGLRRRSLRLRDGSRSQILAGHQYPICSNTKAMRLLGLALALGCLAIGCAPAQFPTPEQTRAAIAAAWADKKERINPEVLKGMWIGDKGSVLSFGPDYNISYRRGVDGNPTKGTYKLEGYKLLIGGRSQGYISMFK